MICKANPQLQSAELIRIMNDSDFAHYKKEFMDHLANFFSSLQTAHLRQKSILVIPYTNQLWQICAVLYAEGLVMGFGLDRPLRPQSLSIALKYGSTGPFPVPVIQSIVKISRQGRRVYIQAKKLGELSSPELVFLVSTSRGILSSQDAEFFGLGGEILCKIQKRA